MRVAIIGLATATAILAASYEPVPFPGGFREWNPEAVQGYRTGVFDDHAIIAYELLESARDSQTNRAVSDQGAKCFACHEKQKARGYVFSRIRE